MRTVAETVVGIVLTLLVALVLAGLLLGIDNADPARALVQEGPALLFGAFWIAILLWAALVVAGNVIHRSKAPRVRVLHNLLSALAASIVNLIVYAVLGAVAGGFGMLLVGIALVAAIAFLAGAAIAVPLTHLVLFRQPRPAAPERIPPPVSPAA